MASTPIDSMKVKDSGLMKICLAAKSTPDGARERGAAGEGEQLHPHERHAHRLRRGLVLADRLPRPADVRVLEPPVDEHRDAHDQQHEEVEVERIDRRWGPARCRGPAAAGSKKIGRPRDGRDALGAIGEVDGLVEVVGEDADHLAEAEGHEGEIVAVQAQDGQAEQEARSRRHRRRRRRGRRRTTTGAAGRRCRRRSGWPGATRRSPTSRPRPRRRPRSRGRGARPGRRRC